MRITHVGRLILVLLLLEIAEAQSGPKPPEDFPHFSVPGHEAQMNSLRELYWLHYKPAGPLATLWDEWISGPTLWPALESTGAMHTIRDRWRTTLLGRIIDPEGYVATHQHASIAHQLGWPFPFWKQGGPGAWGWHFSLQGVPGGWHGTKEKTQEGWKVFGGQDDGIADHAWNLRLTGRNAMIQTPPLRIETLQSPFIQLRWRAQGLGNAQPYLEWTTIDSETFSVDRRFYFSPVESKTVRYTMIPVFKHARWSGTITGLRVGFGNAKASGSVGIQALFTQYDTRHNINNQNFVRGSAIYFRWTRDINFLRDNIQRMRLAIRYLMTEMKTTKENCIVTPFVGHCGRSGIELRKDGTKVIHYGRGIGNNYWDLLPMGHKDAYATIHYYDTLNQMIELERGIAGHPEWDIPGGPLRIDPAELAGHAKKIKEVSGRLFWNPETKRFVSGLDIDGNGHDYGFTFLNLEAIYYDFATPRQAEDILSWISGDRLVAGDTSQGADIYRWRFGPRSTTKRNIEYYGWFWSGPESIPWGGQVQDGGAVLGFSYHDMMARLKVRGPDDAWGRLREVVHWFDDVQKAGGYRAYYKDGKQGTTLQGGGTAGGLGVDHEFFESILVPQVVIDGFLGFRPTCEGFALAPRLPHDWPELRVDQIHLHDVVLDIRVTPSTIAITKKGPLDEPLRVRIPSGVWTCQHRNETGKIVSEEKISSEKAPAIVTWFDTDGLRLRKN